MNNQVFITLDSLRFDVFEQAKIPFLRSLGEWKKATTQATYTLPAHTSFFVGKLPQVFDGTDYFDTAATRHEEGRGLFRNGDRIWHLGGAEADHPAIYTLEGRNIIEGFGKLGYRTIGSGAVNWFNVSLPAAHTLTHMFDEFEFHGLTAARAQIDWAVERIQVAERDGRKFFLFLNFGETHHPFRFKGCGWGSEGSPFGDPEKCLQRQGACLEYLDAELPRLFDSLRNYDMVMCADHGEALGEDGLWGHGFYHPTIMEVPMLVSLARSGPGPMRNIKKWVGRTIRRG